MWLPDFGVSKMVSGDVEGDGGGVGDVEAGERAGGGQPREAVAGLASEPAKALALGAEHQRDAVADR